MHVYLKFLKNVYNNTDIILYTRETISMCLSLNVNARKLSYLFICSLIRVM